MTRALVVLAGAGLALAPLPAAAGAGAGASAGAEVTIAVAGLRNAKGIVRACLTAKPAAFPNCDKDPAAHKASVAAADIAAGIHFAGVAPGTYAVALLHDENANGKADFALGMMPREGFGFSRDAKIRMGPPSFADAAVTIAEADRTLPIRMRYLF